MLREIWLGAACVLVLFGVGGIWFPASQHVAALRSRAANLYEETTRNNDLVRRSHELQDVERHVALELQRVGRQTSNDREASALSVLEDESKHNGVEIESIVPQPEISPSPGPSTLLDSVPVTFELHGRFRNIVGFLRAVSRADALVAITGVSVTGAADGSARLDVAVHALFYRLRRYVTGAQ